MLPAKRTDRSWRRLYMADDPTQVTARKGESMPMREVAAIAALLFWAVPALAQTTSTDQSGPSQPQSPPAPTGFWERSNLLGDMGGLRTALGNYGISIGLQKQAEVFANATGGIKRGATGDGLAMLGIGLDTQKAFGWQGGTFNLSVLGIYGPNFSQGYLGTLQTASGIVASPTVRLWELWYQQAFLGGKMDVKIGQQSIDQEFITSQGSSLFLNTMMGWPMLPSADLYAGGPAYPLSSLGVRLRGQPSSNVTILGGVFQDNPPGGPFDDDGQLRGSTRYGVNFNLRTGALLIAELQYAVNQPAASGSTATAGNSGLPGTYKVGVWFDTAKFPDQRFDDTGLSLANPLSTGNPRLHEHNYSFYAVADQTVWQAGGKDPRAIGVFVRPMFAPTDQNLIDFSINGGATFKAPLPGRDNDTFGVGFGVANVSPQASALERDVAFFSGTYVPTRGAETFIEVTYQSQVTPWLQVQPDFQYVWMPGGGVVDPVNPSRRIGNAAVFAVRTTVVF
jgi:porin